MLRLPYKNEALLKAEKERILVGPINFCSVCWVCSVHPKLYNVPHRLEMGRLMSL